MSNLSPLSFFEYLRDRSYDEYVQECRKRGLSPMSRAQIERVSQQIAGKSTWIPVIEWGSGQ